MHCGEDNVSDDGRVKLGSEVEDRVRFLLFEERVNPNCCGVLAEDAGAYVDAVTPLIRATRAGRVSLVETLLEAGASIHVPSIFGRFPSEFINEASSSQTRSKLRRLFDEASVQPLHATVVTAIHNVKLATAIDKMAGFSVIKSLVDAMADVNAPATAPTTTDFTRMYGQEEAITPLCRASYLAHTKEMVDVVKLLVENGAKVNIPTMPIGHTPLWDALHGIYYWDHDDIPVPDERLELVQYLIDKGSDMEVTNSKGQDILCYGQRMRDHADLKLFCMLVDAGAPVSLGELQWNVKDKLDDPRDSNQAFTRSVCREHFQRGASARMVPRETFRNCHSSIKRFLIAWGYQTEKFSDNGLSYGEREEMRLQRAIQEARDLPDDEFSVDDVHYHIANRLWPFRLVSGIAEDKFRLVTRPWSRLTHERYKSGHKKALRAVLLCGHQWSALKRGPKVPNEMWTYIFSFLNYADWTM